MIFKVEISKNAQKDLKKIPAFILISLNDWIFQVEKYGLEEIRKIKGYHDEPLKGDRLGQRSIRLNKAYRAIYVIVNGTVEFVEIIGVNKHDY